MLRTCRMRVANRPTPGPPYDSGTPKLCPSPTAMSAPQRARRPHDGQRQRLGGRGDQQRAGRRGDAVHGAQVLDDAEEVGIAEHHGSGARVDVLVEPREVDPAVGAERRLEQLDLAGALQVGRASPARYSGMQRARQR